MKGDERNCGFLTRVYYRYASAAIITVDISRPNTFESAKSWVVDLKDKYDQNIPKVLFINKCDLTQFRIDSKKIDEFCSEHNLIGWYCVSAKTGENIEDSLQYLVSQIMNLKSYENDKSTFQLKSVASEVECKKNNDVKKLSKMTFLTQIDSYIADPATDNIRLHETCDYCEQNDGKCC